MVLPLATERLIGQADIDLAYCLAVHLIKDQQLSTDAQLVLLLKVRSALENFQNEGALEEFEQKQNDGVEASMQSNENPKRKAKVKAPLIPSSFVSSKD